MAEDQDWRPDPASHVYVYVQLADRIAAQIASGKLPAGARLAGERDMAELYGVALLTVRRALVELRDRGLIVTVPAKGSFVADPPPPPAAGASS